MVHTVTKFTPVDAMKPTNLAQVKFNLELRAKKQRTYPDLEVGDYVRVFYQKDELDKERHSNWMPNKERVKEIKESMGQTVYLLDNFRLPNAFVRRDLLKVPPPSEAEAASIAEGDVRTQSGRPVNPRSDRQRIVKAKQKAKAKTRPKGKRLGALKNKKYLIIEPHCFFAFSVRGSYHGFPRSSFSSDCICIHDFCNTICVMLPVGFELPRPSSSLLYQRVDRVS